MSRPRRWDDPFEGRDNFPAFDEALSAKKGDRPSDNVDQSMCSTASSAALSIGARAALNEHMRHVAKYGLDDSQYGTRMMEENFSPQRPQNPLDEAWEKLVDTSNNNLLHLSSSSANENSFVSFADLRLAPAQDDGGGGEGIEIMAADQSSDYFNTSKVMLLQTPERNRSRKIRAVTSRQEGSEEEEESFGSGNDASPPMMHLFQQQVMAQQSAPAADLSQFSEVGGGTPGRDHSFVSLSAVDLSRISAEGSEVHAPTAPTRPSPDSSFALQDHCTTIFEVPLDAESRQDAPLASTISPLSPTAAFRPTPPRPHVARTFPPTWSPPKRSPPSSSHYKENNSTPNFVESLGFSPIGTRAAKSTARTTSHSSSNSRQRTSERLTSQSLFTESHQRKPSSFHTAPALLGPDSSSTLRPRRRPQQLAGGSAGMVVEYNSSLTDDISPLHSSSEHKKNDGSMMSTSSSTSLNRTALSASSSILVGDRRFYRTVVPQRVFWKEPEDFPEQYDSFSVPVARSPNRIIQSDVRTVKTEP